MTCVIKHITHPYPAEIYQARMDHAHITGQELVERPWWYEDTERKFMYHDIFGCIGWPTEVTDKEIGVPGYAAIVAVVRPPGLDKETHYNPENANFLLLTETEHDDVPTLLNECLKMREKYGYGIQPNLLKVWHGDPERFLTTVALFNERLGERRAILFTPPDDFYTPSIFDNYVRSLRSCLQPGRKRLFFGESDILKTRMLEFKRDDPAVMAAGGLVHSLLGRCMWMNQRDANIFTVEEEVA